MTKFIMGGIIVHRRVLGMKTATKVTLSRDVLREARRVAQEREVSFSVLVERALDAYLRELILRRKDDAVKNKRARRR